MGTRPDPVSDQESMSKTPASLPSNRPVDALLPPEMARRCEEVGAAKADRDRLSLVVLATLAGAFIAFGSIFMTVVLAGSNELPFGVARLLSGLVFSVGLMLVIVGGAELFTGDNLMVMAWASGRIRTLRLLRIWFYVYAGNAIGAIGTSLFAVLSGHHRFGSGTIGKTALAIAEAKASLPLLDVFFLGILANVLVCMAVWASIGGRTLVDKVVVIVLPVAAFVAAGFEHSIANIYFFSMALLIKLAASADFWTLIGTSPGGYAGISFWAAVANVVVATLGNIVGGGVLVAAVYWFVYLRKR